VASAFTHAFVGYALATVYVGGHPPRRLALLAAGCAVLPDADAVGFLLRIPYGSLLGHRGLSHSLAFALLTGLIVTALAYRDLRPRTAAFRGRALFFAAVTASHGVLDALTSGGLGVAFFSPAVLTRYFFPWRPIAVSPVNPGQFFGRAALRILETELRWAWLPAIALVLTSFAVRRLRRG
jgi:inner membrane protein